jgi:hypothetical protein
VAAVQSNTKPKQNQTKQNMIGFFVCTGCSFPRSNFLSENNAMRIAIEGCAHGALDEIYEAIRQVEKSTGTKVDLLICCGDFQVRKQIKIQNSIHAFIHPSMTCTTPTGGTRPLRFGMPCLSSQISIHEQLLQILCRACKSSMSNTVYWRESRSIQSPP